MSSKIDYGEVLFELKDGTEYASLHADAFRAAMRERDMLRAEREVWANIAQERNDLRAEVERLQEERDAITDPETGQTYLVVAEWRQEDAPGVMACTSYEVIDGPKRYARKWDSLPDRIEWGWVLNPAAKRV